MVLACKTKVNHREVTHFMNKNNPILKRDSKEQQQLNMEDIKINLEQEDSILLVVNQGNNQ